jgi:hypothetical protein
MLLRIRLREPTPSRSIANATPVGTDGTFLPTPFPAVHTKKIAVVFDGGRLPLLRCGVGLDIPNGIPRSGTVLVSWHVPIDGWVLTDLNLGVAHVQIL